MEGAIARLQIVANDVVSFRLRIDVGDPFVPRECLGSATDRIVEHAGQMRASQELKRARVFEAVMACRN